MDNGLFVGKGGGLSMDTHLSFTIQGDIEGYVTFECPFCGSEFKLQAGEFQDDEFPVEELFCPYCGLTRKVQAFVARDVKEHARALAMNYAIEQLNKAFKSTSGSINRSGKGIIRMEYKPLKKVKVSEIHENDTVECEFSCACCQHRVKVLYCAGVSKVFCPYCGVDV